MELQRLTADHEAAVLAFEIANRAYFATSIGDRGDDYFRDFAQRHRAALAEQESGECAFYVLVEEGEVVGRFNLYDLVDGAADVGYRLAERVAGRGVATVALLELCRLARDDHRLRTLRAGVSDANLGSQRVLEKAGFVRTGPADPAEIGGKQGWRYELSLAPAPAARLPRKP